MASCWALVMVLKLERHAKKLAPVPSGRSIAKGGDSHRSQKADDDDHDHNFDEREALCVRVFVHWIGLLSVRMMYDKALERAAHAGMRSGACTGNRKCPHFHRLSRVALVR